MRGRDLKVPGPQNLSNLITPTLCKLNTEEFLGKLIFLVFMVNMYINRN